MKRTIVQEGRKTSDGETPSGAVSLVTQEASSEPSGGQETVEEKRRTPVSDVEKGLNKSEEGTLDVKEGHVEKADSS